MRLGKCPPDAPGKQDKLAKPDHHVMTTASTLVAIVGFDRWFVHYLTEVK